MNVYRSEHVLVVLVSQCFYSLITAQCEHAPDAEAQKTLLYRKIFLDYYLGRWTYNVIPEYRINAHYNKQRVDERNKDGVFMKDNNKSFQTRIYGEPKCRRNGNVRRHSTISTKSTCPWYVVLDVDMNREPQTMAKAKCSCKHCFTVEGDGRQRDRCTTINAYVPVIKWECPDSYSGKDAYYRYFIHIEEVPVGCTCKRPKHSTVNQNTK